MAWHTSKAAVVRGLAWVLPYVGYVRMVSLCAE